MTTGVPSLSKLSVTSAGLLQLNGTASSSLQLGELVVSVGGKNS